jgi:hypothetical protein
MRVPFPTLRSQVRSNFEVAARISTSYPSAPPKVGNGIGPRAGRTVLRELPGSGLARVVGFAR